MKNDISSQHGEYFNHNDDAESYDEDVLDETNPVRTGYKALLHWIGSQGVPWAEVIDLGCGTGNTILALPEMKKIHAVDISEKMIVKAKEKLRNVPHLQFIQSDFLAFCHGFDNQVDYIVSTYAIHHLLQEEKHRLFEYTARLLKKGGFCIFGDLMFRNESYKKEMHRKYPELVEEFEDEFYWDIEQETAKLESLGFSVYVKRFSDLSWGIKGIRHYPIVN